MTDRQAASQTTPGDPGLDAVDRLYQRLLIDHEWSVRSERGFTWWGHRQAQRIWAEPPIESLGTHVSRVTVSTDCWWDDPDRTDLDREIAVLNRLATLGAYVRDPDGVIRLRSSMFVHEEIVPMAVHLLAAAAPLQLWEAELGIRKAVRLGLEPAFTDHPDSGPRREPDEIVGVPEAIFVPMGRGGSAWAGSEEFGQVAAALRRAGVDCVAGVSRLRAVLPFLSGEPTPGRRLSGPVAEDPRATLLIVRTDARHPLLGSGLLLLLELPDMDDAETAARFATGLNRLARGVGERPELHARRPMPPPCAPALSVRAVRSEYERLTCASTVQCHRSQAGGTTCC